MPFPVPSKTPRGPHFSQALLNDVVCSNGKEKNEGKDKRTDVEVQTRIPQSSLSGPLHLAK